MSKKIVQTAGRDALGEFAPEFAHYNDDVLFGENWNNGDLDLKTRSLITVVALMAQGITDSSLKYHIQNAKNHGVTQKEMAAAITHVAFYAGWPKGWAVFNLAKEIYHESVKEATEKDRYQNTISRRPKGGGITSLRGESEMRKRKLMFTLLAAATLMVNTSVWAGSDSEIENYTRNADYESEPDDSKGEESTMLMMVGDMSVEVDWEENESVEALKELAAEDLTIEMFMYGGFEQVGSIGQSLPRNDTQTTTASGDIVLYSGDQLVVFYGSNTWAYTRLGKIVDKTPEEMEELLGNGDVTITLSKR